MPWLFVSYLLPMRFWNHFPYPSALAFALALVPVLVEQYQPGVWSEEFMTFYMTLFIGPLIEGFVTGVTYYWIPGGKEVLGSLFYSDDIFRLFVGNPMSQLKQLAVATGGFFAAQGVFIMKTVSDAWTVAQTVKLGADAVNQMAAAKIKLIQEMLGRTLTFEEINVIFTECKETMNSSAQSKTTVTGNLDISAGKGEMDISHNGSGANFKGSASVDSGLDAAKKMQQAHGQSGFGQGKK